MNYTKLLEAVQDRVDTVGIDQTKQEISEMKLRVWPIYLPDDSETLDGEYYSYKE
jgi:hypothetical protein